MALRVLAGDPEDPNYGAEVTLTVETGGGRWDGRGAPFVRLVGTEGDRKILIGQARVEDTRLSVIISAVWSEEGRWHEVPWQNDYLGDTLKHPRHRVPADEHAAEVVAKAIAEGSRSVVGQLRDLRYAMERQVAELLAPRSGGQPRSATALRMVMVQLVELSTAFSRARDRALECLREYTWQPNDRAKRHVEAMDVELSDEVTRLQSLLGSVSTFAVAQEGEAQQRFNMLAAVAAAGLGLPALILSLYGADDYLPFTWDTAWRGLVPIAIALSVAAAVILRRMPVQATAKHYKAAFGLIAGLIGILLLAGLVAPPKADGGRRTPDQPGGTSSTTGRPPASTTGLEPPPSR
ncbi:hypothetical protein [Lentzea sp. NEAU-D7]|uniref:hypothetical protein n=1 Tax=Lentzea sp. NEAU-D7 TaxID=2994667 RepID=UPI00224B22B5|nr:hypothetical protein [Lentzea sp. NEAU-D7]MCX2947724.1 hypothetical protein [Lentzea sp. NEAU-D7]